jgi:hypothetical protein
LSSITDVISQAAKLADESFSNSDWVSWINDGLDDLSEYLYLETNSTVTKESTAEFFALPENFKDMIMVKSSSNTTTYYPVDINDTDTVGYKLFNNKLYLQGLGSIDAVNSLNLFFYRYPTKASTSDVKASLDIPSVFVEAVKLFAVKRACASADELERADLFEEQYQNKKGSIARMSAKSKSKRIGNWKVVR